jgi:hypothetical protein
MNKIRFWFLVSGFWFLVGGRDGDSPKRERGDK